MALEAEQGFDNSSCSGVKRRRLRFVAVYSQQAAAFVSVTLNYMVPTTVALYTSFLYQMQILAQTRPAQTACCFQCNI